MRKKVRIATSILLSLVFCIGTIGVSASELTNEEVVVKENSTLTENPEVFEVDKTDEKEGLAAVEEAGVSVTESEPAMQATDFLLSPFSANYPFTLNAKVFDYGQNIVSLEIDMGQAVEASSLQTGTFTVTASGTDPLGNIDAGDSVGIFNNVQRTITDCYVSSADNTKIILELAYGNTVAGANTLTYVLSASRNLDLQLDYSITQNNSFDLQDGTVVPVGTQYDMGSVRDEEVDLFEAKKSASGMNYQMYTPDNANAGSHPLIVWFHGNGEGGVNGYTNNTSQLLANRGGVAWTTDEAQAIFGGAYVIAPQANDTWYYNYSKGYIADATSMIKEVMAANPAIDPNRIYVVGCSAGGYMTWHMMANNPDLFAAGVPICAAIDIAESRGGVATTDEHILSAKNIPIWLVHSKNDTVVSYEESSVRAYNLLKEYGAIYTEYETVTVDGLTFSGHASWVYALRNMPTNNGQSLWTWIAAQTLAAEPTSNSEQGSTPVQTDPVPKVNGTSKAALKKTTGTPNTGDYAAVSGFLILLLVSGIVFTYLVKKKRTY